MKTSTGPSYSGSATSPNNITSASVQWSWEIADTCHKWLMAQTCNVEEVVDLVVLEQFIARLLWRTAKWVQCYCH